MRNMRDTVIKHDGCIPVGYNLSLSEVQELVIRARLGNKDDAIKAVYEAFLYGFVCGNRATVNGKVKRL